MDRKEFENLSVGTRVEFNGKLGVIRQHAGICVKWDDGYMATNFSDQWLKNLSVVESTALTPEFLAASDIEAETPIATAKPQPNVYVEAPDGFEVTGEFRKPVNSDEAFINMYGDVEEWKGRIACGPRVILRRVKPQEQSLEDRIFEMLNNWTIPASSDGKRDLAKRIIDECNTK